MTIIKEFIDEIYSKRNEKVHHCVEMWKVSQKEKQKEVEKKLAQHYQDLIEDTSEHKIDWVSRISGEYSTIIFNLILFNLQYNTIQYSTIQYNTIQYNTIQQTLFYEGNTF